MTNFFAEFSLACDALGQREIDALGEAGITFESILRCGYIGVDRVQKIGRGYLPALFGDPAIILACWATPPSIFCAVDDPVIYNLLALDLGQPTRWWIREPRVPAVLGQHRLEASHLEGAPVELHPTPVSWLRAGGEGVCICGASERIFRRHELAGLAA